MKLPKSAYDWALKHLGSEGDTDLFPTPFEIGAIKQNWRKVREELARIDIENYGWKGSQRFVVPKDILAFRIATQLDPIDSLILAVIIKKYGSKIENRRIPYDNQYVFSYRFSPTDDGRFYGHESTWHNFWKTSLQKASSQECRYVVITDITDYYNQNLSSRVGKSATRIRDSSSYLYGSQKLPRFDDKWRVSRYPRRSPFEPPAC